jgi:soluble lytic murein transglycosylase
LLASILEDFPQGDMALDGAFRLALRRIQKLDWAGAANVLERGLPRARIADESRDQEYAGRERYFLARAWVETGEAARGLTEYEALISDLPFSFYMQLALSRLAALDAGRAAAAEQRALAAAQAVPPEPQPQVRVQAPAFERALALLKQGEASWAEIELNSLPVSDAPSGVSASWLKAQLFSVSGEQRQAHRQVRSRSKDWLARWPVGEWRQVWELAFPRPHHRVVAREALRNEIPESLIYAVMREESGFDPNATSPAQAFGLMQLIRPTAKRFAKELGLRYSDRALLKPAYNIALGSRALRTFQDAFPANPILAIPGYNAGPGRPRRWLKESVSRDFDVWVESIPFTETRRYTKRVLASLGSYEFLYAPNGTAWMLPVHLNLPERPEARL